MAFVGRLIKERPSTISSAKVSEHFVNIPNSANGNCLFESVAQQDNTYTHIVLRQMVCDYYKENKSFLEGGAREEHTELETNIQTAYIVDNIDYGVRGRQLKTLHSDRICKTKQYGGVMDLMVICHILSRSAILFSFDESQLSYQLHFIENDIVGFSNPLFIYYNGKDHFEFLQPIDSGRVVNNTNESRLKPTSAMRKSRSITPPINKHSPATRKRVALSKTDSRPPPKINCYKFAAEMHKRILKFTNMGFSHDNVADTLFKFENESDDIIIDELIRNTSGGRSHIKPNRPVSRKKKRKQPSRK